jgi:hypothetical protein
VGSAWSTYFPTRCYSKSGPHVFVGPIFIEMCRYHKGVNLLPFLIYRCVTTCGDGERTVLRMLCGHCLLYLFHGACFLSMTMPLVPTGEWGLYGGGTGVSLRVRCCVPLVPSPDLPLRPRCEDTCLDVVGPMRGLRCHACSAFCHRRCVQSCPVCERSGPLVS